MVGESNQNVFFIQIYASSFAEFEISEFEISIFDCMYLLHDLLIILLYVKWKSQCLISHEVSERSGVDVGPISVFEYTCTFEK